MPNAIDGKTMISLNDINFRFAFSIVGYYDRQLKNDPRYVKWLARFNRNIDGVGYQRMIGLHKCTENDLTEFYPLRKTGANEKMQSIDLLCLDEWPDELTVGGNLGTRDWSYIEFILAPCNYVHSEFGLEESYDEDTCIADLEAQKEYLGPL